MSKSNVFNLFRSGLLVGVCVLAAHAKAQSFPPAFTKSATYAAGDIVQYGRNWYRAMTAIATNGAYPAAAYGKWELNFVRSNTTLAVGDGQAFGNVVYAWQFARNARIAGAAYLHINIVTTSGNFSETFNSAFSLDHESGDLVSVMGDNAANIRLNFAVGGFILDTRHSLASLSNLTITETSDQNDPGLFVRDSSSISNAQGLTFDNCTNGVEALAASSVGMNDLTMNKCDEGLYADDNSTIAATSFVYSNTIGATAQAIQANSCSTIEAPMSSLTNTVAVGEQPSGNAAFATNNSHINVNGATMANWDIGCDAFWGGTVDGGGVLQSGLTTSARAKYGGEIFLVGATTSGTPILDSNNGSYIYTS